MHRTSIEPHLSGVGLLLWYGILSLLCLGTIRSVSAQPFDQASYDAWKLANNPPAPAPPNGTVVNDPYLQRGGSGTTCDCWVTPDASYSTVNNNNEWDASGFHNADDGSYGPILLPFQFYLYGQFWNTAYININGNVSFGQYYGTFSSTGFPFLDYVMVAPFWADVDLRGPGIGNNIVQFKSTPTAFYVNWTNVGYFNSMTDKVNTFQLIITDGTDPIVPNGANVSFCYKDMQWTTGSASGGVNGFGGTPASVGANQGNGIDYIQFGRFDQPGTAYDGPFGLNDGVSFLDDQYFSFSTDITTANVPPVISGQSVCDSLILCVGQPALFEMVFLSPEPNQITTPSASAPTLPSFAIISSTPGLAATITAGFTPALTDVGYHYVTFEGTDNGNPSLTSTITIVVHVLPAIVVPPATDTVCTYDPPVDLFTLFATPPQPGGDWLDPNSDPHSGIFQPGADVDGIYVYSSPALGGCPETGQVTMTTNTHTSTLVTTDLLCNGASSGTITISTAGNAGPWDYTWTDQNNNTLQTSSGTSGDTFTGPAGTYTVIVVEGANGVGCSDTLTATINEPAPVTITLLVDDTTICKTGNALLNASAQGGTGSVQQQWSNGLAGNGPHGVSPNGTTTYTVFALDANGCSSDTLDVTVTVRPFLQFDIIDSVVTCPEVPVVLAPVNVMGGDGNYAYDWGQGPGTDATETVTLTTSQLVCLILSDGCESPPLERCTWVEVTPLPLLVLSVDSALGCDPFAVTFTVVDTTGGAMVEWDFGDGVITQGPPIVGHAYGTPGAFDVGAVVTWPNGCTDTTLIVDLVTVLALPEADFTWTENPANILWPHVQFNEQAGPYAVTYDWDFAGLGTSQDPDPVFSFPDQFGHTYPVTLYVTNSLGCPDSVTRSVEVEDVLLVYVPNTFTPDGDGLNETFSIVGNDISKVDFELMIFDRWGEMVFRSSDPLLAWNGTMNNGGGEVLAQGVYPYKLRVKAGYSLEKREFVGHITLLK